MVYIYPAKFTKEANGYVVEFIDFPCNTQGDTLEEAIQMAKEAMALYLEDLHISKFPKASIPFRTDNLAEDEFISIIELDIDYFRQKYGSKAVKKTLTIPCWLNKKAEANNLNFSQILQKALKKELGIDI